MRSQSTRSRSLVATLATCVAVAVALPPAAAAPGTLGKAPQAAQAGTTSTPFSFSGNAYGTRVKGGEAPARSGRTAHSWVGCTNLAGKSRTNELADVDLGEGSASGIRTRTWTTRAATPSGAVFSSLSRTRIATAQLGSLEIDGIVIRTRAWHDSRGFHAERVARIGSLSVDGTALRIPTRPGQVVPVPGVGTLTFLAGNEREGADGAWVRGRAVQVEVDATGSIVTLGNAYSAINDQNPAGPMSGWGRAGNVSAADSAITSGKIAVQPLPCQGTDGRWRSNDTAGADLGGRIVLGAASGSVRGDQTDRRNGYASTRGRVANVRLGGGRLVLRAIQGQANLRLVDGRLKRSIEGTTVGAMIVDGERRELPSPGETTRIAGLGTVTIAKRVKPRAKRSVQVIAVQIRLLDDGPGATVINLGEALVRYAPR